MKSKKAPAPRTNLETVTMDPIEPARMKAFGGADSDRWNAHLMGKLVAAIPDAFGDQRSDITQAVATGQLAIKPADPVEAMLAAQMITANTASLDLYRRAWIPEQSFEVRSRFLALADRAARTVAVFAEALDRHRGRGQQQIVVKHVTVNADQAVVADQIVDARPRGGGGGVPQPNQRQPDAKPLSHAPQPPLWREDQDQEPVPVTGDAEWEVPDARR